jgi:HK97 gp10 family phage protein
MIKEKWNISEVIKKIEGRAIDNLMIAAKIVRDDAKRKCPRGDVTRAGRKYHEERKPGSLEKTIRVVAKNKNVRVIAGNKKVYYARFVEYGTSETPPMPFLRPAVAKNRNKIINVVKTGKV